MAPPEPPAKYLPEDMLRAILSKLPVKSQIQCKSVCKTWYRIIGLPDNVLKAILCRLSLKYIVRCRCVCKTWYHILGTSSFAKTHLTYQKEALNPNKYVLYQVGYPCTLLPHSHSIYDGTLDHSKLYNIYNILWRYDGIPLGATDYGICNGLVCLSESDEDYVIGDDIYLWNPTCRKIKKLPQLDNSITDYFSYPSKASLIFGYYDDDFKVVVISPFHYEYIVLIYSLNTNSWSFIGTSSWNMIYSKVHYDVYLSRYHMVKNTKLVDDIVYIIESDHVRCFDLSNETIRVIPFPEDFSHYDQYDNFTIETYGKSIAIFGLESWSGFLTMWILKDKSSFKKAWEKKLVKNEGLYDFRLIGFLNNGSHLVSRLDDGDENCILSDLKFPGEHTFGRAYSPYIYVHTHSNHVESLFLLDEGNLEPIVFHDRNGSS